MAKKQTIKYKPQGNKIVVAPKEVAEKTSGGIYLASETKEKDQRSVTRGKVMALGPTVDICFAILERDEHGKPTKARNIQVGDNIVFTKYSGVDVFEDEILLWVMNDDDVLCLEE